ncbi:hypothetical protein DER29_5439 [Micromonospora sp. M71_S20]|uniref:hypothetical protein n=1 Tax=Micromonospora sp. M71_S20 TaxID=592872 RepID=UPI000EAC23A1|nr:hypothetical protein [Micromonospora sp. M71_S20]RLK12162.1 hypothetical protein DER29_5439 [Micromonospora sp. M71_S20]
MSELERRYHRLLRAYPAEYRRARGAEIVGTYLDLAGPERRWPSPADAADLLRGGLRQRLRAAGAADLIPGVRLAAVLAFFTATALAAVWSVLELHPPRAEWGVPNAGPFVSLGIGVWAAWLLAAVAHAVAPGRWTRRAVALALLSTVAVVPVAALAGLPRPPLFVLLPQVGLGLVALGLPDRLPASVRAAPLIAIAATGLASVNVLPRNDLFLSYYSWTASQILPGAAVVLLLVVLLLGAGLALRADHRGGWALLVLLTPVGLLFLRPLGGAVDGNMRGAPNPGWPVLAATAVVVCLAGPALLPLTIALRKRRRGPGPVASGDRCPTCGRTAERAP